MRDLAPEIKLALGYRIGHLKDEKKAGLAEIRRVLKPGGRLPMVVWVPGWVTSSLPNAFCPMLTGKAGWRKIADEGTFNGMWFAVLERPR